MGSQLVVQRLVDCTVGLAAAVSLATLAAGAARRKRLPVMAALGISCGAVSLYWAWQFWLLRQKTY